MNAIQILAGMDIDPSDHDDLHVSRMFSAFVAVSDGRVVKVTDPSMTHCPLARMFYREFMVPPDDLVTMKRQIARAMEDKIARFGLFTARRELLRGRIEVPYGASEMLMFALRKRVVDAAVVACDGAGTVITDRPDVVQGIGARMNGLFFTTPIPAVVGRLEELGCVVPFADGSINQVEGAREAARRGYRSIAVTVNSFTDEPLSALAAVERERGVRAISLMVCATGVGAERLDEIGRHADLVWSCGSKELRGVVGKKAILQITTKIPVYVLTPDGLDFAAAYASEGDLLGNLDSSKRYLIAGNRHGKKITMGAFRTYLSEADLPVRDPDEPSFREPDGGR